MGNLFSVERACEQAGLNAVITADKSIIVNSDGIILPGVGAFGDAMDILKRKDLITPIKDFVEMGKPFMGICLGMQLLLSESEEFGCHKGLDIIKGSVVRFGTNEACEKGLKIPHVGWNEVYQKCPNLLLDGIPDGTDFYFVHSFRLFPDDRTTVIGITPYCGEFPSVVMKGSVFGTQFHPEKSQPVGFRVLRNFLQNIL